MPYWIGEVTAEMSLPVIKVPPIPFVFVETIWSAKRHSAAEVIISLCLLRKLIMD